MNFADFIKTRGVERIAHVTGADVMTVYQWVSRGRIPRDRWPELMTAYPEVGLPAFQVMEAAAKPRQRAA